MSLHDEILEQPDAARRQLASVRRPRSKRWPPRLRAKPVASVVIAARGTSDHAAIYAQYVLGLRNRLSVGLATPSLVSIYGAELDVRDSLVIGISQSGASPDIVAVVAAAARQGAPTLAITNDPSSPLADGRGPRHRPRRRARSSRSPPRRPTRPRCSRLPGSSLALAARCGGRCRPDRVPSAMAEALGPRSAGPRRWSAQLEPALDRCVIVGRGFEYATAREWALKLKELAQVFADPVFIGRLPPWPDRARPARHSRRSCWRRRATAARWPSCRRPRGPRRRHRRRFADDGRPAALGRWPIQLPAGVPEWLRPVVSIVPGQLFAYHATIARGLDPEAPRSLTKVTRTL